MSLVIGNTYQLDFTRRRTRHRITCYVKLRPVSASTSSSSSIFHIRRVEFFLHRSYFRKPHRIVDSEPFEISLCCLSSAISEVDILVHYSTKGAATATGTTRSRRASSLKFVLELSCEVERPDVFRVYDLDELLGLSETRECTAAAAAQTRTTVSATGEIESEGENDINRQDQPLESIDELESPPVGLTLTPDLDAEDGFETTRSVMELSEDQCDSCGLVHDPSAHFLISLCPEKTCNQLWCKMMIIRHLMLQSQDEVDAVQLNSLRCPFCSSLIPLHVFRWIGLEDGDVSHAIDRWMEGVSLPESEMMAVERTDGDVVVASDESSSDEELRVSEPLSPFIEAPSTATRLKVTYYIPVDRKKSRTARDLFKKRMAPYLQVNSVRPVDIAHGCLSDDPPDVLLFPGGWAPTHVAELRRYPGAVAKVKEYVRRGGGYVGICAGAYCGCTWPVEEGSSYDGGYHLGFVKASVIELGKGKFPVVLEYTDFGADTIKRTKTSDRTIKCRYAGGPIIEPYSDHRREVSDAIVVARFKEKSYSRRSPRHIVGSPAIVCGTYYRGRAVVICPHPEKEEGQPVVLGQVRNLFRWAARRKTKVIRARRTGLLDRGERRKQRPRPWRN